MRKSKHCVIFLFFILSICCGIAMAADSPCDDWEPYTDERCIKIIDETLRTYDDAIKTCQQQQSSSSLVSIHSVEEQDFFSNLLFKTHNVVDEVWIGAKYSSNKFKWADGLNLNFTNWAEGRPSNTVDKACVQMIPDGSSIGKWADEPCNKKNLVVCQKIQTWSVFYLQKELRHSLEDIKKQLDDSRIHIQNLEKNPVPIGFIYVQLPRQPDPKSLWSTVEWEQVTSDYAGLFFRAEGGGSEHFETTQNENIPRIISATYTESPSYSSYSDTGVELNFSLGGTYKIRTNTFHNVSGMSFGGIEINISNGEVRPRNKAVRIWKRIK